MLLLQQNLPPPLASSVSDNFDDNAIDAAKWVNGTVPSQFYGSTYPPTGTSVSETGGKAIVTPSTVEKCANGFAFAKNHDITNSSVFIGQISFAAPPPEQESFFYFGQEADYYGFIIWQGVLYWRRSVADVNTTTSIGSYSATTHARLRIRHVSADNTIKLDTASSTSADPPLESEWTNRASETKNASISVIGLAVFGVGVYVNFGAPGAVPVSFDGFNTATTALTGVTNDGPQSYAASAGVQAEAAQSYASREQVVSDGIQSYNAVAQVFAESAQAYAASGSITAEAPQSYLARESVTKDGLQSYGALESVTANGPQSYGAMQSVLSELQQTYSASNGVFAESTQTYQALSAVTAELAQSYLAVQAVFAEAPQSYAALADNLSVTVDGFQSYGAAAGLTVDGFQQYVATEGVTAQTTSTYFAFQGVSSESSQGYAASAAVQVDMVQAYAAMQGVYAERAQSYQAVLTDGYVVSNARAALIYQLALLHGLVPASPMSTPKGNGLRIAGGVMQTIAGTAQSAGIETIQTEGFAGDINDWIDALAAEIGLTAPVIITPTGLTAGTLELIYSESSTQFVVSRTS